MSRELVDRILPHLEGRKIEKVLEIGGRRSWLERRCSTISVYNAYDEIPAAPGVKKHDPAGPLSLDNASHDLVLTLELFERLKMSQLYMVASESRRILRPGGLWLLSGLSVEGTPLRRLMEGALCKVQGRKALELMHYISPEDWKTLEDVKWKDGFLTQQFLALERL